MHIAQVIFRAGFVMGVVCDAAFSFLIGTSALTTNDQLGFCIPTMQLHNSNYRDAWRLRDTHLRHTV